jgi:hypothetical protein
MITENIWSHTTFFFYWWTLFGVAGWNWNERQNSENAVLNEPHLLPVQRVQNSLIGHE